MDWCSIWSISVESPMSKWFSRNRTSIEFGDCSGSSLWLLECHPSIDHGTTSRAYLSFQETWRNSPEYPNQDTKRVFRNSRCLEESLELPCLTSPFLSISGIIAMVVTDPIGHGLYTMAAPKSRKQQKSSVLFFLVAAETPKSNGWIY